MKSGGRAVNGRWGFESPEEQRTGCEIEYCRGGKRLKERGVAETHKLRTWPIVLVRCRFEEE